MRVSLLAAPAAVSALRVSARGGGANVSGVDVSHYQGNIDWGQVAGAGQYFSFMKASEGTTFVDSQFATNWAGAKAAGLLRGAYHFHRTAADPVEQADHFLATVGPLEPGDMLVLDVEDVNTPIPPAATIAANVRACLEHIKSKAGRVPLVYTGNWYWSGHMADATGFGGYPLWISGYPSTWPAPEYHPAVPSSWSGWTFWQYSDGKTVPPVPGIGSVDSDIFNGDLAALRAFAGAGGPPPPTPAPAPPPATGGYCRHDSPANACGRCPNRAESDCGHHSSGSPYYCQGSHDAQCPPAPAPPPL